MGLYLNSPWYLLLLPLILLPFITTVFEKRPAAWMMLIPLDSLSIWLQRLIRFLGCLALLAIIIGLADLSIRYRTISKTGNGAHIVFVLDRSASMNETFGGRSPSKEEQSKAHAARDLLSRFVDKRPHDLFAVVGFSTQPFYTIPLTESKPAIQAAINSLDTQGLAFTNVAKGLAMGLSYFKDQAHTGSRVVILVSDGAATLDHRAQKTLRDWFERYQVSLYWFFLRTENGLSISSTPDSSTDDNPRVMPERYLDKFFTSLKIPYQSYEIDTSDSLQAAIEQVDKLENSPLQYQQKTPNYSLANYCYVLAFLALLLLILVKLFEAKHDD